MKTDLKINSVSEFIEAVKTITRKTELNNEHRTFWFRGEGSVDFDTPLVPTIYRNLANTFGEKINDHFHSNNIKITEGNINTDFFRKASPFMATMGIENTGWNRYFLMQHYKISTRLLDWTENALLALFFAISDSKSITSDAKVWILNPFKLNNYTIKTILDPKITAHIIPTCTDAIESRKLYTDDKGLNPVELTRRYLKMDFTKDNPDVGSDIYYPLAIYPTLLDKRMAAQKACFTVFGNKINGLISIEDNDEPILDSITISGGQYKENILQELSLLGVDFSSIYPDLDGLGLSINKKYERSLSDNRETIIHGLKEINALKPRS